MASRFWVGGTGTWDASDTTHWASSSNGAGGQTVPVAGDTVALDASSGGGTVTVNHATLNVSSITMGAFTGTLDFATNDNNITLTQFFSISGTGTRTLNMGDGTWTISSGGQTAPWDATTVTNLTLNRNSSTILFSATSSTVTRTFASGGMTYNIVSVAATTTGFPFVISGGPTIATLSFTTTPVNLRFTVGTTTTITNAFTWTGTSGSVFSVSQIGTGGVATVVATGGGTMDYAAIYCMTFTTGTVTATNSYDLKSNTGITITPPSGAVGHIIS